MPPMSPTEPQPPAAADDVSEIVGHPRGTLAIVIVFAAIWLFFHMSGSGQFDDLAGPAFRILQDDDRPCSVSAAASNQNKKETA